MDTFVVIFNDLNLNNFNNKFSRKTHIPHQFLSIRVNSLLESF